MAVGAGDRHRNARPIALAAMLVTSACSGPQPLPADPSRTLYPVAFFTGRSHGEGRLDKRIGEDVDITVDSVGRPRKDGGLLLTQRIGEGDKPPRARRWLLRPTARANVYTGALTDAAGPVRVTVAGPRALIRYRMKNGLEVEQQLALQRDGRTLLNRMKIRKWGIRVATLDETIRKLD